MAFDNEELNQRREARRQEQKFQAGQRRLLRLGVIMTALTLVLCGGALLVTMWIVKQPAKPSLEQTATQPTESQPTPPPTTQPVTPDTVIHFVAGGDVNITDKTVNAGVTGSGYDYTDIFLDVVPTLAGADLAALNFEGSLYGAPYGSAQKSAPTALVQALRNAGVDFLQTANSQSVVNGLSGLSATLQGIRDAGMEPLGTYADAQAFQKTGGYVIREIQGIRIAFVAFTKGMDGMGLPAGSEDCVNLLYKDYSSTYQKVDTEGITAVLKAAQAQNPDITIALLHWGSEFNRKISQSQEQISALMLEQGVDAIIGTHSHYVQEVKFDPQKGTLLAYSLGDFYGDATTAGTEYSLLLNLEITKDGQTGHTAITGVDYTPVYLLDETQTGGGLRLLRIREAMAAYEQNLVNKVSESTYLGMKNALEKIESRMEIG